MKEFRRIEKPMADSVASLIENLTEIQRPIRPT